MKGRNSGITASGSTRPEFMNGDIYRDKYGDMVAVRGVAERRITYRREGYEYDYMMPVYQFRCDFSLVQAASRSRPISREKAHVNIQEVKKMPNVFRGKKRNWHRT